jgi:hypothetical protein
MKRILLMMTAAAAAFMINVFPSAGWGQIGHSTIAQVAQNHLTPQA